LRKALLISILLVQSILCQVLVAQNPQASRYGIYTEYLKGYSLQSSNDISSNIFKIKNNTDKERVFTVQTLTPMRWSVMGNAARTITVAAKDSAFIPVRVYPQEELKGGDIIRINTSLYSEGIHISTGQWIIETEILHDWSAKIVKDETHLLYGSDSTSVQIHFENKGNIDEEFNISYTPSRLLELSHKQNEDVFILKTGRDTTLNVDVRIVEEQENAARLYEQSKRSFDKYSLKVKATVSGQRSRLWQRSATFTKAKTVHKANQQNRNVMPLTIDFQTYDILSENPYASLGLYGMKYFSEDRYLTYDFQFLGATGNYSTLESNYQQLAYYSPRLQVQVGDVNNTDVAGIYMYGKGARVRTLLGKQHALSGIYTQNPKLLQNNNIRNYGLSYEFMTLKKRFDSRLYYQNQKSAVQMYDKDLLGLQMNIIPYLNHRIGLQFDYSRLQFNNTAAAAAPSGYNFIATYYGRFMRSLDLGANYQLSSEDFVSYAGAQNLKAYANLSLGDNHNLMSHYISRTYSPNIWSQGVLVSSGLHSDLEEAKLSYRFRQNRQSLSLYGQYNDYSIPNYDLLWYGGGIDYANALSLYSRFNTSLSFWRNDFNALEDDYTTIQLRVSFRQNNLRVSGMYYYGARYILDHIEYAESLEIPRSYFVNANYDFWTGKKKNILFNIASNFNYRTNIERFQVNLRPNLEYYIAEGFKLKAYASVVVLNQGERIYEVNNENIINPAYTTNRLEMGIGFTKDLGLPISRKENFDVKFIAFCDDNGNGVKDVNEEVIPNMLIVASELKETQDVDFSSFTGHLEIITDNNGEAALLNIEKGNYRVETHPLQKQKTWYTDRNVSIDVFEDKTVYLPQSKGGKIYGSIQLEIDDYSRFENQISLENIKVSASDSAGTTFSCLTDKNGTFILNAPMGRYKLSVNEDLFAGSFELADNDIEVVLDNIFSEKQQNFFVKEKERKVVITKFSDEELDVPEVDGEDLIVPEAEEDNLDIPEDDVEIDVPEADEEEPDMPEVVEEEEQSNTEVNNTSTE